jgi:hypothetical protein
MLRAFINLSGSGTFKLSLNPQSGINTYNMKTRLILLLILLSSASINATAQTAKKSDEYGNIAKEMASLRLDNFALNLMSDPMAQCYIIGYSGTKSKPGEALARANFAKSYLADSRGVDPARITVVDGGTKKEPATELWLVPYGATPPTPSPTVKSGIGKK